jgi:hypothetical protein
VARCFGALIIPVPLLALAPAAPVPKEKPRDEVYYPTTVGTKRVYQYAFGTMTEEVVAVEDTDQGKVVTETLNSATDLRVKKLVSKAGLFVVGRFSDPDRPLPCELKLPFKPGETWAFDVGSGLGSEWRNTAVADEMVEVPAGKFKAIRVTSETTDPGGRPVTVTAWYAPGLGVVKAVARGKTTRVLKSFTLGKK